MRVRDQERDWLETQLVDRVRKTWQLEHFVTTPDVEVRQCWPGWEQGQRLVGDPGNGDAHARDR